MIWKAISVLVAAGFYLTVPSRADLVTTAVVSSVASALYSQYDCSTTGASQSACLGPLGQAVPLEVEATAAYGSVGVQSYLMGLNGSPLSAGTASASDIVTILGGAGTGFIEFDVEVGLQGPLLNASPSPYLFSLIVGGASLSLPPSFERFPDTILELQTSFIYGQPFPVDLSMGADSLASASATIKRIQVFSDPGFKTPVRSYEYADASGAGYNVAGGTLTPEPATGAIGGVVLAGGIVLGLLRKRSFGASH